MTTLEKRAKSSEMVAEINHLDPGFRRDDGGYDATPRSGLGDLGALAVVLYRTKPATRRTRSKGIRPV